MKTRLISYIGICSAVVLTASVVLPQRTATYEELPNFHQVNSQLYRGAQPKQSGFKQLTQLGVKTVINLRAGDGLSQTEEVEARAAGLHYFGVPFKRTGRPTDEQMTRVLAIIDDPANQPVFVHCRLGEDRTGTVIAVYRIVHDGWTSERAKAEANQLGMHPWELGMKDYIHDFYQRRQQGNTAR
jgi:uncharacterized protein (TIGR01244 family)